MGTLGWTPAAQLATQNMEGAARSYASMDKAVNQTQTTKVSGSGIGGALGSAAGGQNAATLGGLGVSGAGVLGKDMGLAGTKMKNGKEVPDWWNWG